MAECTLSETIGSRKDARSLPPDLARVVTTHFPDDPRAGSLVGPFLALTQYNRGFVTELVEFGRGRSRASWRLRLVAVLMLENQCLRLTIEDTDELSWLFGELELLTLDGTTVDADVLRQGYTSTELPVFSGEFLCHLQRLDRIHQYIDGFRTTAEALDDFITISLDPCKVALARYLFTPEEVVERAHENLEISSGITSPLDEPGKRESQLQLSHLPTYEREIVRLLTRNSQIYWTCERTPSAVNGLVENPIGTVVCVVKPPGSSLEFEIKRTGLRSSYPLGATYIGVNGNPVPPSHRLQGGASMASFRWESNHVAIFSEVYRAAHDREAPISKLLALASYRTVPCRGRDVHLFDYFTDPEVFGPGFHKMRQQMRYCVSAFDKQFGDDFADLPGEAGLTGRFLYHVLPCQGLLARTSSYRLDTLANYFSSKGAETYFQSASYSRDEARRFADALLDEVLGRHVTPRSGYVDHAQYLKTAFAVPENRHQANRLHAAAVSDLGLLWGTVLALGGFTYGESFVGRNVGLKSAFAGGEWTSRLLSMDHDNLHVPDDEEEEVFWAQGALRNALLDECFIRGNPGRPKQVPRCALHFLEKIYHLESEHAPVESRRCLELAMAKAYHHTRRALENDRRMRRLFSRSYLRHLRDWHVVVADYLTNVREAEANDFAAWKNRTQAYLAERNYRDQIVENYCRALEKHSDFVRRYSFLYLPAQP